MSRNFIIIGEWKAGTFRQVTYEALQCARSMMNRQDQLHAAVVWDEDMDQEELGALLPVHTIHVFRSKNKGASATACIQEGIKTLRDRFAEKGESIDVIILGHTALGRDTAPLLSCMLSAGLITDIVDMTTIDEDFVFTRPLYAGKAFEQVQPRDFPFVLTVRPNNLPGKPSSSTAVVHGVSLETISIFESGTPKLIKEAEETKQDGETDLSEASVIVSGGRGVKSKEGFQPLKELAEQLNGAVGASRGACDADYCDYGMQIGQTGKMVTPDLYIACGISGAIQHVAGMSQSKTIIAINKDPDAPIFQIADYGIVGDLFEIVPLLTRAIQQHKSTR
ncbi:electron transfer flavoprotein subunit alpha/FixB family protein [Marinicrinis sediminis]|uniref:Electron transfer flavoprotein subunit alpha/FixB family protein n=1 Tax=Marinicrinis sediminis TaxID=1652465 RepID=A0ABW5RDI8_9BACL